MKNFYRDTGLVIAIMSLVAVTFGLAAALYLKDTRLISIFLPFIVLAVGFAIGKLVLVTRKTFQYTGIIKNEIHSADASSLYQFPTSVCIIDKEHRFIWFNPTFMTEFERYANFGTPLSDITAVSLEVLLSSTGAQVKLDDNYYRINATEPHSDRAGDIYVVYFENITAQVVLEIEKKMSHPVVMIITVDSYDEIFSEDSESTATSVMVRIEKLLEDYIRTTNGVLRKISSARFWGVIEERHVRQLIESKVKLLDKAREITVTDRIHVTLSIGIGRTGKDMAESEQFARQALEMALGRGGDQAAVKTKSGFEFYGGFSKGIERHTKVRARIIANSLIDLANNSDIIYIMGHKFSDLDSIGAAVGLAYGLRNLGNSAYVVIDKPSSLGKKLIEKVEAADASDAKLFIDPPKALDAWTSDSLLIIVDTHNVKLLESAELYNRADKCVVIDHHRKMVDYIENALIFHQEVTASSASEMVTELLQYFGPAGSLNGVQADALLAGIMLDTKNFSSQTGARTFEAAAFLRRLGADTVNVKPLFATSIEGYKQKVALVRDAVVYKKCAIACSSGDLQQNGEDGNIRIIAPQAANELLEIAGVDASFLIYKTDFNSVNVSARSNGAINVQVIMEELGGGGHHTMAGTQLTDVSVTAAERRLRSAIEKYFEERTN